jgi:hypothetical protein
VELSITQRKKKLQFSMQCAALLYYLLRTWDNLLSSCSSVAGIIKVAEGTQITPEVLALIERELWCTTHWCTTLKASKGQTPHPLV